MLMAEPLPVANSALALVPVADTLVLRREITPPAVASTVLLSPHCEASSALALLVLCRIVLLLTWMAAPLLAHSTPFSAWVVELSVVPA